ncbi:MAG: serine/threonine protein kinase [Ktedonobacteraceae bacterium]|nr:serine/threonine protein kinase [Ktedonobacteraceae bacterium]
MALEGSQLGRYQLVQRVGSGGMGEIYLANDTRIARQVALKVLRAEPAENTSGMSSDAAARLFHREAQAIAMLDHSFILPLFDYGEEEINGHKVAYLVMPFRNEGTLKDWLRRTRSGKGIIPQQDIAALIAQAASALQYAHNRRIIHQDVKPSNFLIRSNPDHPQRPDILLADFGIAKNANATAQLSNNPRGTPAYMAPEQWHGHAYPATDQYALAIMAYEMLTGHPPFHGSLKQLMQAHLHAKPQPPSTYNPQVSEKIDQVILQALAKEPEERFPSISAFASALQRATTDQSSLNTMTLAHDVPSSPLAATVLPTPAPTLTPQHIQTASRPTPQLTDHTPTEIPHTSIASTSIKSNELPPPVSGEQPRQPRRLGTILIIALVLLVVLAGGTGGFVYFSHQSAIKATATVIPHTPTPTPDPLTSKDNPYPPHTGTLVMDDPLKDNTKGYNWTNDPGVAHLYSCTFSGQAYHAGTIFGGLASCFSSVELDNGTFQVRVTLIKGDSAGLLLRGSSKSNAYYYFYIRNDGSYGLDLYSSDDGGPKTHIKNGGSKAIHTKPGQSNLLAIVAQNDQLDLYINQQLVSTVHDTRSSKGFAGVGASGLLNPAEAIFDSARAWRF